MCSDKLLILKVYRISLLYFGLIPIINVSETKISNNINTGFGE